MDHVTENVTSLLLEIGSGRCQNVPRSFVPPRHYDGYMAVLEYHLRGIDERVQRWTVCTLEKKISEFAPLELLPLEIFYLILKKLSLQDMCNLFLSSPMLHIKIKNAPSSMKPIIHISNSALFSKNVVSRWLPTTWDRDEERLVVFPSPGLFQVVGRLDVTFLFLDTTKMIKTEQDWMLKLVLRNLNKFPLENLTISVLITITCCPDWHLLENILKNVRLVKMESQEKTVFNELETLVSSLKDVVSLRLNFRYLSNIIFKVVEEMMSGERPLLELFVCQHMCSFEYMSVREIYKEHIFNIRGSRRLKVVQKDGSEVVYDIYCTHRLFVLEKIN